MINNFQTGSPVYAALPSLANTALYPGHATKARGSGASSRARSEGGQETLPIGSSHDTHAFF